MSLAPSRTASPVTRRTVLKVIGGVGAGLMLGCFADAGRITAGEGSKAALAPNAIVRIDPNGDVIVTVMRSDMGQGVRTSFAMLVAEELDADWNKVKVLQAPADEEKYGSQQTGGSSSITSHNRDLRRAGAVARALLVGAAAKTWGVDPSSCTTDAGVVKHASSGKSLSYGELAGTAATLPIPTEEPKLKDKSEFKLIGKPTNRVDNHDVVTGKAIYGMDVPVEGVVHAVVARPPTIGGSLKSFDDKAARQVPGVIDVVKIGSGVAVVGLDTWAALKGRDALVIDWDRGPNIGVSSATLHEAMVKEVRSHDAAPAGAKVVAATLEFPFLAHASMEPMNAVADVRPDSCTVWVPTQNPSGAKEAAVDASGLPEDKVTVNVTLLGGGFGGRHKADFVSDAVEISKAVKKPVKLQWSREDDMRNDDYRPASHHSFQGAVDSSGNPVAWSHQVVFARGRGGRGYRDAGIMYAIPNAKLAEMGTDSPVRTGPWRSVDHTQVDVANECFIDELASAAGQDPLEFRQKHLRDERVKKVLNAAAQKAGWGTPLPAGHGRGVACFSAYGSCSAYVMEASVEGDKVKLHRVVGVIDVGTAVNPRGVQAQMEGGCVDGLSTALKAEITVDKGAIVQSNWGEYDWLRLNEMPELEIYVMDSGGPFGGMGEVGYPPSPAALANAVFAATGKRVRKFPIKVSELA